MDLTFTKKAVIDASCVDTNERKVNRIMDLNNSIVLEKYSSAEIPMDDWEITDVFDDILMCVYADVPEDTDGDYIVRRGITIPLDVTKHTWRIVRVLKKGKKASEDINEGDLLMIPGDRGISCVQQSSGERQRFIFINEERVFCKVTERADETE